MQKGTVVEKLVEETATDDKHLRSLISVCEGKHIIQYFHRNEIKLK